MAWRARQTPILFSGAQGARALRLRSAAAVSAVIAAADARPSPTHSQVGRLQGEISGTVTGFGAPCRGPGLKITLNNAVDVGAGFGYT